MVRAAGKLAGLETQENSRFFSTAARSRKQRGFPAEISHRTRRVQRPIPDSCVRGFERIAGKLMAEKAGFVHLRAYGARADSHSVNEPTVVCRWSSLAGLPTAVAHVSRERRLAERVGRTLAGTLDSVTGFSPVTSVYRVGPGPVGTSRCHPGCSHFPSRRTNISVSRPRMVRSTPSAWITAS